MIKVFRFSAVCAIGIAFAASIASAQTYKQVDVPFAGAIRTELVGGPNPQGTSVGIWQDAANVFHGFTLTAKGVFTTFDPPGSTFTSPGFISPQGVIVGLYLDSFSVSHGFILNGGKYTTVDVPGAAGTALSGINPSGEIAGFSCTDPACGNSNTSNGSLNESFVRSKNGAFTFFNPPGATSETSTVNPSGAVVGNYTNNNGGFTCFSECQGYLLKNGTYTTINPPNSVFTFAGGGNPQNDIVGEYFEALGPGHAFLLHNGVFTSFDYPEVGVLQTGATGINPDGVIVGIFQDSAGKFHGFIRTP